MRMNQVDLIDYKVIDAATGKEISDVLWVDDASLQYAVADPSGAFSITPDAVWGYVIKLAEVVSAVTRVAMDHANCVIHVNEPPVLMADGGITVRELHPCGECRQAECCRRIDWCAQFKTAFGEARLP